MAISWGPWASGAGGVQTRLGVDWSQSPSTIRSNTSSVTVTIRIYLGHSGFVQDSNFQLVLGGSYSGTTTHSVNRSGSGTVLLRTTSRSYAPIVGQRGHSALTARLSAFIGGSPSLTSNYYSPAKPGGGGGGGTPQTRPAAPTGAIVTRISDSEIRLVWNNHPTSNAPYTGVKIERWDARSGAWGQVAAGGSSSKSWTDTTTTPNNAYRYRVRAYNSVGHSPYSGQSALVMNTPGQPTSVSARRIGSDVRLTWVNGARPGAFTSTEIQHRADGGAWTVIGTGFGTSREDYLHESPSGGGTHQYRIRARANSLLGPWSNLSNVVAIESPPNAPTNLSPGNGQYVPDTGQVQLSWRHNPTDGSDQTKAVVRYGPSESSLTTVNVNGDAQTTLIPAPAAGPDGQELPWYWDVQTYGSHATPSPRTSANPNVIGTPSTEILSPAEGETYEASTLVVQWEHVGIPGATQTGYRVNFYRAGVLIGQASGSGSLNTWTWDGRLTDTETYTVTVQTRDLDSGLWTAVTSSEFTVDLLKPPTPDILAGWVPDEGVVNITVNNPDAGEGEAEVIGFELWRATDAETIRAVEEWERSLTARQDAMTEAAGKVTWVEQAEEPAGDANLLWIDGDGTPNVWADYGPDPRENLVINPRFDPAGPQPTPTYGSGGTGTMTQDVDESGSPFARMTWTNTFPASGGVFGFGLDALSPTAGAVAPGDMVAGSIEVRSSITRSVQVRHRIVNASGSMVAQEIIYVADLPAGVWTQLDVPGWIAPANSSRAVFDAVNIVDWTGADGPRDGETLDIRHPLIEKAAAAGDYGDGSMPGWEWTGTANDSTSTYSGPGWVYAGDDVVQAGDDAAAGAVGVRATLDALWEQHAVKVSSVGVDESITDHAPPVGVPVAYRVLASSAIPSVAVSETLLISTTPHHTWIWLNAGEGWGESIKMRRGGNIKVSHVQEKVRVQYKGRRRRVEYLGDAVEDRVTVNVRLDEEDGSCSFDELIDMLDRPAPLLYRDPTGRMWEVSSDATTLDHHARLKYVTFDLERTDG